MSGWAISSPTSFFAAIGRRPLATAGALGAALVTLLLVAVTVDAQEATDPLAARVVAVDASGERVDAMVLTDDSISSAAVIEDGREKPATLSSARARDIATEVVFVVDLHNRSLPDGVLADFTQTIESLLPKTGGPVRVGLVGAGAEADVMSRLSADMREPVTELREVFVHRDSSIVDGIGLASQLLGESPGVVRTVVVLAAGPDTASQNSASEIEATLIQKGAQLISVTAGTPDPALDSLVARVGGVNLTVQPGAEVRSATERAILLATDRLIVSFPRTVEGDRVGAELRLDDQALAFSYPNGLVTTNPLQLTPLVGEPVTSGGALSSPMLLYLSIGLAFVAISGGLWALISMFGTESSLDAVLARYAEGEETLDEGEVQEMLVQTALLQRAIDMTEHFAERRGVLTRVEEMLERANLPIRAGEAIGVVGLGTVGVFVAARIFVGSFLVAAIVAVVAAGVSYLGLQMAAKRRLKAFEGQLPDALQLLSGTMRAGYSLPQGLDAVSREISDPMGHELRRAITEAQLGRELDDALANVAERLDSADFAWAVMAIGIQREVGGNLAEVLLTVAETMVQRERLQREVNALTAEGRVSAGILAMLPPGLGVIMYLMNPAYIGTLFERTLGLILLGLAVVSGLIGLAWMKKVVTIDA